MVIYSVYTLLSFLCIAIFVCHLDVLSIFKHNCFSCPQSVTFKTLINTFAQG